MGRRTTTRTWREGEIAALEAIERQALTAADHGPAVAARKEIGRHREAVVADREAERIAAIRDPIARAEAMARAALAAGSFVAAQRAAAQADELRKQRDLEARERQALELDGQSVEVLQELLEESLDAMPLTIIERLMERLSRRLSGPAEVE